MARTASPWGRPEDVRSLAASWHRRFEGRAVVRVGGGPGWLRLVLETREAETPPAHLFLLARAGAVMCWDDASPRRASGRTPSAGPPRNGSPRRRCWIPGWNPSPHRKASDCCSSRFTTPAGGRLVLSHQLFGQRGNLVLADAAGRRVWSAHASPHPATLAPPPPPAPAGAADDDVADLCRRTGAALLAKRLHLETVTAAATALRRAQETATRLRDNLARDLAGADRGEEVRIDAETLAIHLHEVARGAEEVELADADGRPRRIRLDPTLAPAANLDRLFHRARKAERGRETVAARLRETETRLERLATLAGELEALARPDTPLPELLEWRTRHADLLGSDRRVVAGRRETPEEPLPFRRFLLENRWEVWVGRNDRENDELTHRAAAPDDVWLHAQGVPGSHVVLRAGGRPEQVPRSVLERAAGIAAWYSKARNSSLVPVIHTLRKYVRKPRRSPAGTAACIREKTVMATPALPADTSAPEPLTSP